MCGVSPTTFSNWVARGIVPPAIPGTRRWDREAIAAKFGEAFGASTTKADEFEKWDKRYRERRDAREAYRPRIALRSDQRRVLMYMAEHPDCQTIDAIPNAGERTMEILINAGVVQKVGKGRCALTKLGQEEAARLAVWISPG